MTPESTSNCTFRAVVVFRCLYYLSSKLIRVTLPRGMTYAPKQNVATAIMAADTIYGRNIRLKLIPAENIAMISEFSASLEVKKITAMKTNKGLNRLAK